MDPSPGAEASRTLSTEDRLLAAEAPSPDDPERLPRPRSCSWLQVVVSGRASLLPGTILSTRRSIICSRRSSRLASGGSDLCPASGAVSSANSWLRHIVPRCLHPMQMASSAESNWHLIFRLLPTGCQILSCGRRGTIMMGCMSHSSISLREVG